MAMKRFNLEMEEAAETFSRNSIAFLDGVQFAENAKRTCTVAVPSVSDGEILSATGDGGESILAQAIAGNYIYGFGLTTYKLYRSSDGITWSRSGLWDTAINGPLHATSQGTLLWVDNDRKRLYRSTNGGASFSQVNTWTQSSTGIVLKWGFCEHDGVLMMCEYGPSSVLGGRYLQKSTDDGATWSIAYDLNTRTQKPYHFHTVAYHRATGKWIAAFGDTIGLRNIIVSSDNGSSWTDLYIQGNLHTQPVCFYDDGDKETILFGDDGAFTVGRLNLSTGYIETIHNDTLRDANAYYAFALTKIGGIYYAGSADTSLSGSERTVLWVSSDLVNWSVYHRFDSSAVSDFHHILGSFAGKIWAIVHASGPRTFTISPAKVSTASGILLEPAATNLRNTVDLSSFETSSTLNAASLNITVSHTTEESMHGNYSAKVTGIDGDSGTKNVCIRNLTLGNASEDKDYIFTIYLKSSGNLFCFAALRNNSGELLTPHLPSYVSIDRNWKRLTVGPIRIAAGTPQIYYFYISFIQGTKAATLYADCFQITELPCTQWQVGGIAKSADILEETITLPKTWTNSFAIQTTEQSRYYAKDLLIKRWEYDSSNYLDLLWNAGDSVFELQRTIAGSAQTPVQSTLQNWYPKAVIKFVLRLSSSETSLSIQNGRAVETITDDGIEALVDNEITAVYGDYPMVCITGWARNEYIPFWISDDEVESIMNLSTPTYARISAVKQSLLGGRGLRGRYNY